MPIIDINEVEKRALAKKEDTSAIITKSIDGKTYFKGKFLADWFDSYDECQKANQDWYRINTNKSLGLNEHGQSPEQVAKMAKKRLLDKDIAEMQGKLAQMQAEQQSFNATEVPVVKSEKKKGK